MIEKLTAKDRRLLELQLKLDKVFKRTSHGAILSANEGEDPFE